MFFPKIILMTAFIASITACTDSKPKQEHAQAASAAGPAQTLSSKAGSIEIPKTLHRIAVLDTNTLNTIQELGGSELVVALPKGTPLPKALDQFKDDKFIDVGTLVEPNLEKIASSQPELILMGGRMEKVLAQIKQIAPTYFVDVNYNDHYNSFKAQTLSIAEMIGKKPQAEQQLNKLEQDIATLKTKTTGKTALVILVNNNKISAYGPGSRFGHIHDLYGFVPADPSIKVGLHGMSISHEFIAEKNPDYLFVIDRGAAITETQNNAKTVLDNNIVKTTNAFKNGHIVYLDSSNWYLMNDSLGGMRGMLKEVSDAIQD